MKTTYFVSGFMRSGTSMMMDALTAGGLDPAFDVGRNELNQAFGDDKYKPNPNGFYELKREDYLEVGFPRKFEGKLIKCLYGGINRIVPGDYKIVFMRRDIEEIRQSYEGFFSRGLQQNVETLDQRLDDTCGVLNMRKDVEVTQLQYRDVVEDPLKIFENLRDTGWPIDPRKAASVVNPDLCRFRIENLVIGA